MAGVYNLVTSFMDNPNKELLIEGSQKIVALVESKIYFNKILMNLFCCLVVNTFNCPCSNFRYKLSCTLLHFIYFKFKYK